MNFGKDFSVDTGNAGDELLTSYGGDLIAATATTDTAMEALANIADP